jgi:hypothetical protein
MTVTYGYECLSKLKKLIKADGATPAKANRKFKVDSINKKNPQTHRSGILY